MIRMNRHRQAQMNTSGTNRRDDSMKSSRAICNPLVLALLTALGTQGLAFAQNDPFGAIKKKPQIVIDDDEDAVEEVLVQPAFMMADENFDQWLYREHKNP